MHARKWAGRQTLVVSGCLVVLMFGWLSPTGWGDEPDNKQASPPQAAPKADRTLKIDDQIAPKTEEAMVAYGVLTRGTANLDVTAKNGQSWRGTGWIVDAERRLVVTNMHVSSGVKLDLEYASIDAWFPVVMDGEAIHDIAYYSQNVKQIPGTVVYTDATRDLALIQLDSLPDEATALKLADKSAKIGQMLHSLAGFPDGSEGLFIYTQGTSRAVYKRSIATGTQIVVMESQMPMNGGNSGGPIVNDQGEVVAVTEGAMIAPTVRLVSMSIDISEVKAFLSDALPMVKPETVPDWNKRGDHHYEAGRYDLAMSDYNEALKLDPKNAEATANRGWVHYKRGDLDTALAEFEEAIKCDPANTYAFWGRGTVYRDRREFDKAGKEFTQAIRNTTDAKELAVLYNDRGNTYYGDEKYEEALADYDRSIEKNSDDAWTHANRGDALGHLDRYDEAFASLDKAIALDGTNGDFWNIAGNLWIHRRNDFAIKMYTNAISANPNEAVYYRNRGSAQRELESYQEAVSDLLKAVELAKDKDEYWNELGLAWYGIETYEQAVAAFSRAIEQNGKEPMYYRNRGAAYQRLDQHEQAIADLTKAIQTADTAEFRVMRARSYKAIGNAKAAKADFEKAGESGEPVDDAATDNQASKTGKSGESVDDAATDKQASNPLYDRKSVKVVNKTPNELKVYLKYYTKTTDGNWQWFPDEPGKGDPISYTFEPGESAFLSDDDWKVNASRIRIWAQSAQRVWVDFRDQDLVLVEDVDEGYRGKSADVLDTAVIPFGE